jgi:SUN domain-containing protein 1/2
LCWRPHLTYLFLYTRPQGYTDKAAVADESKSVLLGEYRYDIYGTQVQTFAVQPDAQLDAEQSFSVIKLAVSSNYGHEDFTCVYRFRVHGDAV